MQSQLRIASCGSASGARLGAVRGVPARVLGTPSGRKFQYAPSIVGASYSRPTVCFASTPREAEPLCEEEVGPSSSSQPIPAEKWRTASGLVNKHFGGGPLLLSAATLLSLGGGALGSGFSLEGPGSALGALSILALIVAVHECGHFLAATSQGIHVSKFAIGFGPALYTYKGEKVEYSLRLIPLGGYVAFPDDDPNQESPYAPDDPDLLKNRSIPERAAVISAGVIANILFAYFALLVQVGTVGKAITEYMPGVKIPDVGLGSAAARSGLRNGDLVLKVDGWQIPADVNQVQDVVQRIRMSPGREMSFMVQRDGTVIEVPCVPDTMSDGSGRIGVQIFSNAFINHIKARDVPDAFNIATEEFNRLAGVVANGLKQIIFNFSKMAGQLSGPVAIVAAGSEIARTDAAGLFQFCAIININLAAVNVLPLPALDGGYLLLLAIEGLRGGKKIPQELEQGFMASGLLLLTAAGMGLVVRDTINLIGL